MDEVILFFGLQADGPRFASASCSTIARGIQVLRLLLSAVLLAAGLVSSAVLQASAVIVPDDFATVQSAIDSGADTVHIRSGAYTETPQSLRGIVLLGTGPTRPRLNGLAIFNHDLFASKAWTMARISFSEPVSITTDNVSPRLLEISFLECDLSEGLQHAISHNPDDIAHLRIVNSHIGGNSHARAFRITMDSDTVYANVSWSAVSQVSIINCWFRGNAGRAIEVSGDGVQGSISHNRIDGYDVGIHGTDMDFASIESNTIINANTAGLFLLGGRAVTLSNNEIRDCGIGVYSESELPQVYDNRILGSHGDGMRFSKPDMFVAERNVVGRSKGSGIVVQRPYTRTVLRKNTAFGNHGSGYRIIGPIENPSGASLIHNNIGFGNRDWGIDIYDAAPIELECNDWFGNVLGAVSTRVPSPSDVNINPEFCDVESDDVRLMAASALVNTASCGTIGALGVGCGTTATLLTVFSASVENRVVRVSWGFPSFEGVTSTWLERSDHVNGPWEGVPGIPRQEGSVVVQSDLNIRSGLTYWYRAAWRRQGVENHSPPLQVVVPSSPISLALFPNPTLGVVNLRWTAPGPGNGDVSLFDASGRLVSRQVSGWRPPGPQTLTLTRDAFGVGSLAPGWYIAVIRGAGYAVSKRFLVVR